MLKLASSSLQYKLTLKLQVMDVHDFLCDFYS